MIFFFTGTGNSEYAARKIARKMKVSAVSIGKSMKAGVNRFYLADGEALGFVFPIYAWSVPEIVKRFISEMALENYSDQYVFAVFTCGASIGSAYGDLKKCLADAGITLKYARDLMMPDNYIVMFKSASPEKREKIFAAADVAINAIAKDVAAKSEDTVITGKVPAKVFSRAMNSLFRKYALGTKKFHVTDACISCDFCKKVCPESAIIMEEGRPRWHKKSCAKCMACINRCPVQAIEYGSSTKNRQRYVHPIYSKKNRRGGGTGASPEPGGA